MFGEATLRLGTPRAHRGRFVDHLAGHLGQRFEPGEQLMRQREPVGLGQLERGGADLGERAHAPSLPRPPPAAIVDLAAAQNVAAIASRGAYTAGVTFTYELEREADGRWLAEVMELPGCIAYGRSAEHALAIAHALVVRVLAERIEHGDTPAVT